MMWISVHIDGRKRHVGEQATAMHSLTNEISYHMIKVFAYL